MTSLIQSSDPKLPPHLREDLKRRRPRAAAATEFGQALAALGIKQSTVARWFRIGERSVRRWEGGARKVPPGVTVVCRLMLAGKVSIADVEQADSLDGAEPGPPTGPALEPPAAALAQAVTVADQICKLGEHDCRWPIGDPASAGFRFCGRETRRPPYCEEHRDIAFIVEEAGAPHERPNYQVWHGRFSNPRLFAAAPPPRADPAATHA